MFLFIVEEKVQSQICREWWRKWLIFSMTWALVTRTAVARPLKTNSAEPDHEIKTEKKLEVKTQIVMNTIDSFWRYLLPTVIYENPKIFSRFSRCKGIRWQIGETDFYEVEGRFGEPKDSTLTASAPLHFSLRFAAQQALECSHDIVFALFISIRAFLESKELP